MSKEGFEKRNNFFWSTTFSWPHHKFHTGKNLNFEKTVKIKIAIFALLAQQKYFSLDSKWHFSKKHKIISLIFTRLTANSSSQDLFFHFYQTFLIPRVKKKVLRSLKIETKRYNRKLNEIT
jgi:hypothetical protein